MDLSPTPHPDVNEILDLLLQNVSGILKDQLVGMYLFGSLANGDFDQDSDIDVLVVTDTILSSNSFNALKEMHERITRIHSPWAIQMEVSYIPKEALRRQDPSNNQHPHMDRGNGEILHIMQHDSDWIIQRHILHEHGITVTGPDPKSLIDPVSSENLKWAATDILNGWIKGFLEAPHILQNRGYQSYTVLTLCRILHTLEYGTVVSKPVAAEWAIRTLPLEWHPLIERAWFGRRNPSQKTVANELDDTLNFIRYTLESRK